MEVLFGNICESDSKVKGSYEQNFQNLNLNVNKHCEGNHLFCQVYFYIIIIF